MQVAGSHLLGILTHEAEQVEADIEQLAGGHVVGRNTTAVLVGGLHQTHHQAGRLDVVRVDIHRGGGILELMEQTNRCVHFVSQFLGGLGQLGLEAGIVTAVLDHLLGADTTLGMRTGGELVTGGANTVTGGEQTVDRGHAVVAPLVLMRTRAINGGYPILVRAGGPDAAATGMGAQHVGFGRHDLGTNLLRLDVHACPQAGLADGHVEEVFPCLGLEVLPELLDFLLVLAGGTLCIQEGVESDLGGHVDRAAASLQLVEHQVVTQTGRGDRGGAVRHELLELALCIRAVGVELAQAVLHLGLEQQEPGADRTVPILEAGGGEAVFHHGQGCTDLGTHGVGGTGVPYRVPSATLALTGGPGTEDVDRAAAGDQGSLALVDMHLVLAGGETDGTGDGVLFVLVKQHLDDEHALMHVGLAQGLLGGLGNDALVGLTVDHDLPLTGTNRHTAFTQGLGRLGTVQVAAVVGTLPDRQTPLLEQLDRLVNVTTEVINEVFANNAHQVVADHLDIVFDGVLTDVGVDGGKTLGNGAGALEGGLVHQDDFHALGGPLVDLERRAACSHTAANDQHIALMLYDFRIDNGSKLAFRLIR